MRNPSGHLIALTLLGIVVTTGCASTGSQSPFLNLWANRGEDTDRLVSLARLEERHGKLAESEAVLKRVLELNPKHVEAHHRLGVIAVREGRLDDGLVKLQTAQSMVQKPNAELLTDLGYCLYLKNDSAGAEGYLREALQVDPRNKRARNNLGILLGERGDFDAALAEFRQAGNEAEALANLAYVQTRFGDLSAAEKNYHAAVATDGSLRSAAEALVQIAEIKARSQGMPVPPSVPIVNFPTTLPVVPTSFQSELGATPTAGPTAGQTAGQTPALSGHQGASNMPRTNGAAPRVPAPSGYVSSGIPANGNPANGNPANGSEPTVSADSGRILSPSPPTAPNLMPLSVPSAVPMPSLPRASQGSTFVPANSATSAWSSPATTRLLPTN